MYSSSHKIRYWFVVAIIGTYGQLNTAENNGPMCRAKFSSKNFVKYWKFLDLFRSCTFHVSVRQEACWQLLNSFIQKCSVYQNCVSLHSSNVKKYHNRHPQSKNSRKKTLEDTTRFFKAVFAKSKHSAFCLVQLPSTMITKFSTSKLLYYMDKNSWKGLLSSAKRHPDYLIIPTINTPTTESLNSLPTEWPSKVLYLKGNSGNTKTIFLACLSCLGPHNLITLQEFSLTSIHTTWNYFHSNKLNRKQSVKKFMPMSILQLNALGGHSETRIANMIIKWHYNSTNLSREWKYWVVKTGFYTKYMHFTSVGATFPGFKFSVIGKASTDNTFSLSTLQLFGKTFSFEVKITLIILVYLMGLFLKCSIGLKDTIFWLFSVTFEQGSVDKNLTKLCVKFVVSIWLLVSLYLRIVYTTDMYTDITSVPIPSVLPAAIPILLNESIDIKTGPCSKERLYKQWIQGSNRNLVGDLEEQIYNKSKDLHLGLLTLEWDDLFSRITKKRANWSTNLKREVYAGQTEEFAVLYETSACSDKFVNRLISMLDKRTIYETNNPSVWPKIKIAHWTTKRFIAEFAIKTFWGIVESGIHDWIRISMQTFLHQKMFDTMSKEGFEFENVGVFYTFANQIVTGQRKQRNARSVGGNIRIGNYVSRQYFSRGDWFGKAIASINDLVVVWVLFIVLTVVSIFAFVVELSVDPFIYMIKSTKMLLK